MEQLIIATAERTLRLWFAARRRVRTIRLAAWLVAARTETALFGTRRIRNALLAYKMARLLEMEFKKRKWN